MTTRNEIGIVHYGLGPIGLSAASIVAERPGLVSVAAIDADPNMRGRRLSELNGSRSNQSPSVVPSLDHVKLDGAKVAIHCTGSSLTRVAPQLLELIGAGLDIVSTCEELSFPWMRRDGLPILLHERAVARGVSVLGTGVNPGFAMDYLPIVLAATMTRVDSIKVVRVADASKRRVPLQQKVGVGLTVAEFTERVGAGQLGHVGLRESAAALASVFGWRIDSYAERVEPVVSDRTVSFRAGAVDAGHVLGLHQVAEARAGGTLLVQLDLTLAIVDVPPSDVIRLEGRPPIEMRIPGGLHGDIATAAIVVNSISPLVEARPGLLTMAQLSPPRIWQPRDEPPIAAV